MEPNRLYSLADLAALPVDKADAARERAEFDEVRKRAAAKGNRALALLNSRECNPWLNPSLQKVSPKDFEVAS